MCQALSEALGVQWGVGRSPCPHGVHIQNRKADSRPFMMLGSAERRGTEQGRAVSGEGTDDIVQDENKVRWRAMLVPGGDAVDGGKMG